MLDFLASKGALTAAALLMLVMMVAAVDMLSESSEQRVYENIADNLAQTLSEVNASPGNVSVTLVFDERGPDIPGVHFPQEIGGDWYSVVIYGDTLVVEDSRGRPRAIADISGDVHGWAREDCTTTKDPDGLGLTSVDIGECDMELNGGRPWVFDTRNPLVLDVMREEQRIDGVRDHLTMIRAR